LVINASGYTDVARAEHERTACWDINVTGVANLLQALRRQPCGLLHISTDYVFDGQVGNYKESDTPGPPCNYYALTKLVGEQIAATWDECLVIRTSFRDGIWPHPVAFDDLFTSQDYLDVVAPDIALLVSCWGQFSDRILHIATERKSAFELARRRRPDVKVGSRCDAKVTLPADISLDITRWTQLKARLLASIGKEVSSLGCA